MSVKPPFKIKKAIDNPSSAFEHIPHEPVKQPYVHEKKNIKVGKIQQFHPIHMPDEYDRQKCLENYEHIQNKLKIPAPFKCPKQLRAKKQSMPKEQILEFGKSVLLKSITRQVAQAQDQNQRSKLSQLKQRANLLFKYRPVDTKPLKNPFKKISALKQLLNLKDSVQPEKILDDILIKKALPPKQQQIHKQRSQTSQEIYRPKSSEKVEMLNQQQSPSVKSISRSIPKNPIRNKRNNSLSVKTASFSEIQHKPSESLMNYLPSTAKAEIAQSMLNQEASQQNDEITGQGLLSINKVQEAVPQQEEVLDTNENPVPEIEIEEACTVVVTQIKEKRSFRSINK